MQGTRANQPSNFADLSEIVELSAQVHDDETAVDQLQFVWTAPAGTFSGSGGRITWQAPSSSVTPATVVISVEVVERYGPAGGQLEHRVSRTATVNLHDSVKEVGDMARQFLLDFSDSSIRDVAYIMRNFEPACYGTAQETEDVTNNRRDLRITDYSVGPAAVTVRFGGVCPFRDRPGDACARVPVYWASVWAADGSRAPPVRGADQIAAMYQRGERRWRLCDSQFDGELATILRKYFR